MNRREIPGQARVWPCIWIGGVRESFVNVNSDSRVGLPDVTFDEDVISSSLLDLDAEGLKKLVFETGFDKRLIDRRDVARGDNLDRVGVTDESLELGGDRSRLVCDQSFDVELILDVRLLVVAGHACNEDGAQQRHQC